MACNFSWVGLIFYMKQTTRYPTQPNSPQAPYSRVGLDMYPNVVRIVWSTSGYDTGHKADQLLYYVYITPNLSVYKYVHGIQRALKCSVVVVETLYYDVI